MLNDWHDLFVATAGAAAALTGLIFVGVSLNLTKILSFESLPNRALLSLILLLNILIVSILVLIPNQTVFFLGLEILIAGIILYAFIITLDIKNYKKTPAQYRKQYLMHIAIDQIAALSYVFAGLSILFFGNDGIYIIIPGIIFSFIKSIFDSWVLLVEINR
jgi:modulator of FtsH protease